MKRKWIIRAHDSAVIAAIERTAGVSPIVAQLLAARGVEDAAAIRKFLEANFLDLSAPDLLPGVPEAVDRITDAIAAGKRIVVYGDYDADGMTATAILFRCLRLLGGNVTTFVPSRLDDGYGLNNDALERLKNEGAAMVVTVDCGIASVVEAETARRFGLELIITDHHQFGRELPVAAAIVHPGLPGGSGEPSRSGPRRVVPSRTFTELCGAGVALKLAWALCQRASGAERVSEAHKSFLLLALGLAAIGTVADVVPLRNENRLIVRHGLTFLAHESVVGLTELMKLCGLADQRVLDAEDIAFNIAPRLNAAGRLGQAQLGVELLVTDDAVRAKALAEYLNHLNSSRESLERKIQKAAFQQIRDNGLSDDAAIVLADRDWHAGIIGIVAGRVAERFNRPVVLVARSTTGTTPGTGSGRSACGVDLYRALESCGEHLVSFGGHRAAAGLRIIDENIDAFREALVEYVAANTDPVMFEARLDIDLEVSLAHLTLETMSELEKLAPFGAENRRPVFCVCGARLAAAPRKMGEGERHLSLSLEQGGVVLRSVAFGRGDWAELLDHEQGVYDFAFRPVVNRFRGRRSVELQVIDWRESVVAVPAAV